MNDKKTKLIMTVEETDKGGIYLFYNGKSYSLDRKMKEILFHFMENFGSPIKNN